MSQLSIGQVAETTGLRPSAIRYYESEGLVPAPDRVGGKRRYGPDALDRLAVIQLAQEAGFTLAEIRTLVHGFSTRTPASKRWRRLAEDKIAEVDARIRQAQAMKRLLQNLMECGCIQLEDCGRARRLMESPASS